MEGLEQEILDRLDSLQDQMHRNVAWIIKEGKARGKDIHYDSATHVYLLSKIAELQIIIEKSTKGDR